MYFDDETPCGGGLLALDGRDGSTLWQHWCSHSVYWVDCGADLTGDGVNDCLISGRGGLLEVINSHDGSSLWILNNLSSSSPEVEDRSAAVNVYAGRFVQDLDGDGVQDVLAAHTEETNVNDSGSPLCGHLVVVSGRTGKQLHQVSTPQAEESYYPPQTLVRIDGESVVVWGTGGIHSPGGLYVMPLASLATGHISQEQSLFWDEFKGVMSPPSLVDVNLDGLEDIVVATFNSSVLAFDGLTYKLLWNYSFIGSESSSTPIPGYFNEDNVPDFLVKYQSGPGSPIYYYTQTTILDGKTGASLVDNVMTDSAGLQPGGLSVGVEGFGNDLFLHWGGNCLHHEGQRDPYAFLPGELLEYQINANLCKLRFNSTLVTKFLALSEHVEPPGVAVYSSDQRQPIEYRDYVNTTAEFLKYIDEHPDFWATYPADKPITKQHSVDFSGENGVEVLRSGGTNFHHKEGSILQDEQRKGPGFYYPNREYNVPNRGRNREPGGRVFSGGEDEEMLPSYPSNSEYPDVRKHGIDFSQHSVRPGPWRHQWQNADLQPEDNPDVSAVNSYQDVPPARIFSGSIPVEEQDFDIPSMYLDEGYPPGQRDERTAFSQPRELPHGPRLRGDKRGQERDKRQGVEPPAEGVQKQSSAGVLVPSFSNSMNDSVDVVFSTYWVPASDKIHILLQKHIDCVGKKLSETTNIRERYPGMDSVSIKNAVARECLNLKPKENNMKETDSELNLKMGQMTVYRVRLKCTCRSLTADERCSSVLPFNQQGWPTTLGVRGNGYFKPRHK